MMTVPGEILKGVVTGVVAGFSSGLVGVSPGGFLVPIASLTLGVPQHLAQAISLVAQAPPTSLSGVSNYRKGGHTAPISWVIILSCGFVLGGVAGAALTSRFSNHELRWMFVGYLLILAVVSAVRGRKAKEAAAGHERRHVAWAGLVVIGAVGGFSSGLLGIGGGLAITALSAILLRIGQHQAQSLSLMMLALPLTLPAAWVYVRQGAHLPWWAIAGILLGLVVGTKGGAIVANKLPERKLKVAFIVFIVVILGMAIYMAVTA
jgi:uncharacterized membrane protein YfcA